jgi:kynurenine formamidase
MKAPGRIHDLSATLRTHMPVWPTSPLPVIEPVGVIARDGYAVERLTCLTHTGTHLDAPFHFLEDGKTVDAIPPQDLVGSAMVIDLRQELNGTVVSRATLEKRWPQGKSPAFALLETGWSRERALTRRYLYEFPGIEPAAAQFLVEKGVKGVGTDTLSVDPFANSGFEAHKVLLRRGVWILEALDHLDELREGTEYTLVVAPLKIEGGSGAMSRVFAFEG